MTSADPVLQFAVVSGLLLAGALVLLMAIARRGIPLLLACASPTERVGLSLALLLLPLLAGAAYAGLTLLIPQALGGTATFAAVCAVHDESLLHACLWHPTETGSSAVLWLGLTAAALALGALGGRAFGRVRRSQREVAAMLRLSRPWQRAQNVHVVEADRLVALACGIGPRRIVLSSSLLRRLSPQQLEVVLAHEEAHLRHRDALIMLAARALSVFHLPAVRRELMRALGLATEQRCDLAAARTVGSRLAVAETILTVERALQAQGPVPTPAPAAAFADGFVSERIEALLHPAPAATTALRGAWLAAAALVIGALSAGWLHHLTESLIALLAG